MLSGYRLMWLLVMFDLPVITKKERKEASKFRLDLLDLGFLRCQLSVYGKFCSSLEKTHTIIGHVKNLLPPKGSVDILTITDTQFKKIISFNERKNVAQKNAPNQLELF